MRAAGHDPKFYTNPMTIQCPFTPRLKDIKSEVNCILLDNYMNNLFMVRDEFFQPGKRLRPAIEAYLASLLYFFEDIEIDHGSDHFVIRQMKRVGAELGITANTLKSWGEVIKADFLLNSAKFEIQHVEHKVVVGVMSAIAAQAKMDHLSLLREVKGLKSDMQSMMKGFENLLKEALSRPQDSTEGSSKKRKKSQVNVFIYI